MNPINYKMDYKTVRTTKLVDLANDNDTFAQQEIIDRFFDGHSVSSLVRPHEWIGFIDKACRDSKYMYFFLIYCMNRYFVGHELFIKLYNKIMENFENNDTFSQINVGLIHEMCYIHYNEILENNSKSNTFIKLSDNKFNKFIFLGEAEKIYTVLADQGNKYGQYNLARLYLEIEYLYSSNWPITMDSIIDLFIKAAEQEHVTLEIFLAIYYHTGTYSRLQYGNNNIIFSRCNRSVIDCNKAIYWYKKALHHGSPNALYDLGKMYEHGNGVDRDISKAVEFYNKIQKDFPYYDKGILSHIFNKVTVRIQKKYVSEEIELVESNLLAKCQHLFIKFKYKKSIKNELMVDVLQQIENTIYQIIKWRHEINSRDNILIGCINFTSSQSAHYVQKKQKVTGITPYVKQHKLCNKYYVTFGHNNVNLVDSIIEAIRYKKIYKQVILLLDKINLQVTNNYKKTEIIHALESLESITNKFDCCYQMFIDNIRYNQNDKNNRFMEKYWLN
ncbi:hypothetical protein [Acanthamoeba polyphaga mimivirus]|uniref:Sel1-like repeat-containing protein n=1 Tax=Acanthamoeba polyphaga mimivirus TaxID=212035 RepID=A0A0G2Y2X0_MIMIV|nr:hypothetical protein [Acanthamoeba polyphaga mimivirus]